MARYRIATISAAALAQNAGFAWLMCSANNGFKLRRLTLGTAGAGIPVSQQVAVGVNRVTNAGTTPTAGMTPDKLDANSAAAGTVFNNAYATPPALTANDFFVIPFNTQSGVDLPAEMIEEWVSAAGVTNGLAFINRQNAMPAGVSIVLNATWEE